MLASGGFNHSELRETNQSQLNEFDHTSGQLLFGGLSFSFWLAK